MNNEKRGAKAPQPFMGQKGTGTYRKISKDFFFSPNQIKSTNENEGTWENDDGSILNISEQEPKHQLEIKRANGRYATSETVTVVNTNDHTFTSDFIGNNNDDTSKNLLQDTYSIKEACELLGISRTGLQYYRIGGTYKYVYKGNEYVTKKEPVLLYRKDWDYDPKGGGIRITEKGIKKLKLVIKKKDKMVCPNCVQDVLLKA